MESTAKQITVTQDPGFVVISTAAALTDRQVDIRAKKWLELDAQIKALSAERDAIRAELIDAGSRKTKTHVVTVTNTLRPGIDTARLKAEKPKIYAEYQKQIPQTRFSVKAI